MPDAADDLPFEIQRSLLRVIQEALTNTYRHAACSRVRIDLRFGARP
jgi:two-component system, NarL family, sensor kinase